MSTSLQFGLPRGIAFLVFSMCMLVAPNVYAAELVARMPDVVGVGDVFVVPILLDTEGDSINTLEGTLTYPTDTLRLREIRDGNTTVSLWVERPLEVTPGKVRFAGVIPGGYQGTEAEMMTLVFEAQASGRGRFVLNDGMAYRNDGTGQSSPMPLRSAAFDIEESGSGAQVAPLTEGDATPPGIFMPVVSSDPSLLDGKWFVAFATQDKESGIDYFEVAERQGFRFPLFQKLDWKRATSPVVLSDQSQRSYIYVKAVDRAGNSVTARLSPAHPPFYFSDIALVVILLVLLGAIYFYVRTRGTFQTK